MEFLLVILVLLGVVFLYVPYLLVRLVLHLTLACFTDKTSPQAAAAVRQAANVCLLLGGCLSLLVLVNCSGNLPVGALFTFLPMLSLWSATITPLRVKAPAPVKPSEAGFTHFEEL